MKNTILALFSVCLLIVASGCDKDDDVVTTPITPEAVNATAISGTWKISLYTDSGTDETSEFSGFNFTFGSNGRVNGANGILSVSGTWSAIKEDNKTKFPLTFSTTSLTQFEELNEDWEVYERTDTKLALRDTSGNGASGFDQLTFQKN